MSAFNLEKVGRSTEKSIREAGFDPAALLRGDVDSVPPSTEPPPSTDLPPSETPSGGKGTTNTPIIPSPTISTLPPGQIQLIIPEGTVDGQAYVENYVRELLKLDGRKPPESNLPSGMANPADESDLYDDAALLAELAAWFVWKAGGSGAEPTIPTTWKAVAQRVFEVADVSSLTFKSSNAVLTIEGLTTDQFRYIYRVPGFELEPEVIKAEATVGGVEIDWSFLDEPGAVQTSNLPAPVGGAPMTMSVLGTGAALAARYGPQVIGLIKTLGIAGAIAYITNELVGQGADPQEASAAANALVNEAGKKKRRRRRRMLTCSDKEDIQFLIGILGKGEMGKTAVAALLAGCRR